MAAPKELAVMAAMAQLDKALEELDQSATRFCDRTISSVPLVAQLDAFRAMINDIRRGIACALDQGEGAERLATEGSDTQSNPGWPEREER